MMRFHSFTNLPNTKRLWFVMTVLFTSACSDSNSNPPPQTGTPNPPGWQRQSDNPLLLGSFDTTTIKYGPADPGVLFDTDDNKWKVWYATSLKDRGTGNLTSVIQYIESTDGHSWSTPITVLQAATDPNAWDYTNVETPSVIKNPNPFGPADKKYMMWYSGANTTLAAGENRPAQPTYYQIGLAYSADGKAFTRRTPGIDNKPGMVLRADAAIFGASLPGVFGDGLVADPKVLVKDGVYHMWFSSYAESVPDPVAPEGRSPLAFGISHLVSGDGVTWSPNHANPLASLYKPGDLGGGQQPSVLFNEQTQRFEMWFSNDTETEKASIPCSFNTVLGFWHASSSDGVDWIPDYSQRDLVYDAGIGYENSGFLTGIEVLRVNQQTYAFYSAWGTDQVPGLPDFACPDQNNGLLTAVLSLNQARYTPP